MVSLHLKSNNDSFPSKVSSLFNLFNSYIVVLIFYFPLFLINTMFYFILLQTKREKKNGIDFIILHINVTSFSLAERFFILTTKIS